MTLVDLPGENLEEDNIVRHALGYDSLHKLKTTELAKYIHNLNPETPIECIEMDVNAEKNQFASLVEARDSDMILECTDNDPTKHSISEVAVRTRTPVVGGAVYDGGIAGEVYAALPGGACYGCIAAHQQQTAVKPKQERTIDYDNLNLPEIRSTPALNIDIAQIALIHARVALNILLDGEVDLIGIPNEVNLIIFANRTVPGHFQRPLHAEFYHIERHPDCLVCGRYSQQTIDSEAERILRQLEH